MSTISEQLSNIFRGTKDVQRLVNAAGTFSAIKDEQNAGEKKNNGQKQIFFALKPPPSFEDVSIDRI